MDVCTSLVYGAGDIVGEGVDDTVYFWPEEEGENHILNWQVMIYGVQQNQIRC